MKAVFRERFDRSRGSYNKSQYLRIQALYLSQAGLHRDAINLLDELFDRYPDRSQIASARKQRAECLLSLSRIPEAVDEYRRSLEAERAIPTVKTGAWLDFACLIAFHGMSQLYDEAANVLDEFSAVSALIFPLQRFQYAAARAFLADARGDTDDARAFAKAALDEASATHSGFRYHPQLGLVNGLDNKLEARLAAMGGS
ncbi:MAG: hypothetical protein ACTHLZ_14560 [Tepidisphaeraceae bacterium]